MLSSTVTISPMLAKVQSIGHPAKFELEINSAYLVYVPCNIWDMLKQFIVYLKSKFTGQLVFLFAKSCSPKCELLVPVTVLLKFWG